MTRINTKILIQMADNGTPVTEIASYFKVTTPAVYKALKKCGLETSKTMVAGAVKEVVKHKLDAIEQLTEANRKVNAIAESLSDREDDDGIELVLKAVAEIRKQVNTALAIQKTLWRVEDVKEVLDGIISIIKKHVTPEVQRLIAEEVQKQRSLTLEVK